jgi:hypothetical protein
LEEWTAEADRESKASKKIHDKAGKHTTDDDEAREEEELMEDGQMPIPPLLPPFHREAAMDGGNQPQSPSVHLSPPATVATSVESTSSSDVSSTSSSARPSSSLSTPAVVSSIVRDPKYRIELKDHESIKSHYPLPEDISQLHTRSGFFCSSFIAACYMKMGLLPAYPPIDWYLLNTFSSRTTIQPPLSALINAQFGDDTLVAKSTQDKRKNKWTNPHIIKQQSKQSRAPQQSKAKAVRSTEAGTLSLRFVRLIRLILFSSCARSFTHTHDWCSVYSRVDCVGRR